MIRVVIFMLAMIWIQPLLADDLQVLRMSLEQRQALHDHLESTPCDCGCGMTVGECLRDDPACPVSPEMARNAIAQLLNPEPAAESESGSGDSSEYINSSQNGSVVSGRVDGQDCTYASAGGTTVRLCD